MSITPWNTMTKE